MNLHKPRPKKIWFVVFAITIIGLCPVSLSWINEDYTTPNVLKIRRQDIKCMSDAYILKGKMDIPESLLEKHPEIKDPVTEIELAGNAPFSEPDDESKSPEVLFLDDVRAVGTVTDIGYRECGSSPGTFIPVFEVGYWDPAGYYPVFFNFNWFFFCMYIMVSVVGVFYFLWWMIFLWEKKG